MIVLILRTLFLISMLCGSTGVVSADNSQVVPTLAENSKSLLGDLSDAAALVRAGRVTHDSKLLCQAEVLIDKFISENLPENEEKLTLRCYALKRRLSNLCALGLLDSASNAEADQIEHEILGINARWQLIRGWYLFADPSSQPAVAFLLIGLAVGGVAGILGNRFYSARTASARKVGAIPPQKPGSTTLQVDRLSTINQGLSMIDEILPLAASSRDLTYFDNVPIALVSLNERGEIRSTNTRFAAMTGMLVSELHGKLFADFLRVGDNADRANSFKTIKQQLLEGQVEGWLRQGTSDWMPVDVTAADFSAGKRKGTLVSIMDRSARQQMEEMRRGFVSMVSHDLAAPLSSLGLFFDLIRHSSAYQSEDYKLAVSNAEEETGRLMKLVTDLLDVSKLESGKFSLERSEVSALHLVRSALNSVRYLAEQKDLFLENDCADVTINVDAERIMQVLINLLSNAVKFSPTDGRIVVEGHSAAGGFMFTVTDEGPGVPEDKRDLIFDRFAQASASDKKHGAGLGLSICKLIVDQHGGRISVDEAEQRGARFSVFLPASTE